MRRLINLTITALVVFAAVSGVAAAEGVDYVSPDARDSARQVSSPQTDLRSPAPATRVDAAGRDLHAHARARPRRRRAAGRKRERCLLDGPHQWPRRAGSASIDAFASLGVTGVWAHVRTPLPAGLIRSG
jgi:hypothetical protein